MERIIKYISEHAGLMPFFLMTTNGRVKVNGQRIIEAIVIAIVIGVVQWYLSFTTLQVTMGYIQKDMSKIENRITKIEDNIYMIKSNVDK